MHREVLVEKSFGKMRRNHPRLPRVKHQVPVLPWMFLYREHSIKQSINDCKEKSVSKMGEREDTLHRIDRDHLALILDNVDNPASTFPLST